MKNVLFVLLSMFSAFDNKRIIINVKMQATKGANDCKFAEHLVSNTRNLIICISNHKLGRGFSIGPVFCPILFAHILSMYFVCYMFANKILLKSNHKLSLTNINS